MDGRERLQVSSNSHRRLENGNIVSPMGDERTTRRPVDAGDISDDYGKFRCDVDWCDYCNLWSYTRTVD